MSELTRCIFSGMQILIKRQWVSQQAIVIENKKIIAILPVDMIKHHLPAKHYTFPDSYYLIPGLIDLHLHGAHGHDVMDANPEALIAISKVLSREGVTGYLATTMTTSNEHIEKVLKSVNVAMQNSEGAAILGVHLEGPFIAEAKLGAQSRNGIQVPNVKVMQYWQTLAQNSIRLVTLAPELPGAIELIDALRKMDIIVSIGHTNATYEQTQLAITTGCTQATHLFNAMSGLHQREPGAVGALLISENITTELIVDGWHLHPAIVELVWKMKGNDKIVLVTDAMRAKCLGNGSYELGGQMVNVKASKAILKDGTLAGSTLRLPQAIKNMMQYTKCSLADAIYMASSNPAKVLGLLSCKGTISVGKDADLAVLDSDFEVKMTIRAGKEIFKEG